MKKLFSILLIAVLFIPSMMLFSACGKNKGYDLSNLSTDFYSIADKNNNIVKVANKLKFDYSQHQISGDTYLLETVYTVKPYTTIKDYNLVLDNVMAFVYTHIDLCSNNSIAIDSEYKSKVKSDLDAFSEAMSDTNIHVNYFAERIKQSYTDSSIAITSSACLSRYQNLLDSYDNLYQTAINFSNTLSNIYFNHALKNANPNVYDIAVEDFDPNIVVNKLNSRIKYQISNLSETFVEMYINGGKLSESIVTKVGDAFGSFNLNKYNYIDKVNAIDVEIDENTVLGKIRENGVLKDSYSEFYDLSIQAYNLQTILMNDNEKFLSASNAIDYLTAKANTDATAYDNMCVRVIEDYDYAISSYNTVLVDMIALIK